MTKAKKPWTIPESEGRGMVARLRNDALLGEQRETLVASLPADLAAAIGRFQKDKKLKRRETAVIHLLRLAVGRS